MAGTIVSDVLQDGAGNSTATTNAIKGSAKAWVKFDSTGAIYGGSGTGSYNVSSVTKNSTGNWTANFTTAMPNTSYALVGTTKWVTSYGSIVSPITYSTGSANFETVGYGVGNFDPTYTNIAVFSS
jgi:hypothetical protein